MQITRFGHSCLLVETGQARVLIDPGNYSDGWTDLGGLDAVFVTHRHPDHVDPARFPGFVAGHPGLDVYAEAGVLADFPAAGGTALTAGQQVTVKDVQVTAVGGHHAVIHPEIPRIGNVGLVIAAPDEPVLFHPGDEIDTSPEGIDVLAVPMMAPWSKVSETVEFVRAVGARFAIPIHDGLLNDRGFALIADRVTAMGGSEFVPLGSGWPWTVPAVR
ncbi:MBL fold metallo-hydrolase [Propionibacterium australiense]|uniref:Beta-lactamase superfamily domain n=1 Tax=Propionibacterium australiense TaxID=119981 RepID=A0A383S7K9_9ACTN|nr:MBL fold metallo-hydrolase [Propionibacterium australiense]RLP07958.1 MBL fold metallo-hydrolase [Propionibacterium australiense]RLP08776.1 MBL fold metallo-hydrolase [Propionibacterium australiense]SYZ33359.1 Beta-lactamase superfamily domain [Propionibacterium australiense]VEH89738.1 metal-dependent hydrolase [Propionibacterium australiense]